MMHPEPIVLTRELHFDEIVSAPISQRERLRQLDERALDVLYNDQLRTVAHAMQEPPVMHLPRAEIWLIGAMLWVPLIVIGLEWFRP